MGATGVIHTLGGGVQTVSMAPHSISGGGFGQLATVTPGTRIAQEVQETYGGSVPITTVHDNKVTDYFHSAQHEHLLHADNINRFKDKGTVVGVYDISRQDLINQGRLIIKDPIDVQPRQQAVTYQAPAPATITAAPATITTMSAPMTYVQSSVIGTISAPMTYMQPIAVA